MWLKRCWTPLPAHVTFDAQGNRLRRLETLATDFSTEIVEASERFALWKETTARSHMINHLRSENQNDFRAVMRGLDLGETQVSALAYPHLGIARTAKLRRQSDPEVYQINYFYGGKGVICLKGGDTELNTGDLVLMDSGLLYRGDVLGAGANGLI